MRILKKLPILLFTAALLLCGTAVALAAPLISISSSGNGIFALQASGFAKVGGGTINIAYDTKTLANPRVAQGGLISSALFVPNTTKQGVVILGFVIPTGISGDGVLATITFGLPGSSPGAIQSLTVDLIGVDNKKIASQTQINNPSGVSSPATATATDAAQDTASSDNPPTTTTDPTASSTSGSGSSGTVVMGGGTVTMPAEGESAGEKLQEEVQPGGGIVQEERTVTSKADESETSGSAQQSQAGVSGEKSSKQSVSYKSVLEKFASFTGVKSYKSLSAIFENNDMQGIRQEPPVVLSDGVAIAKVFITSPPTQEKEAPNFALVGAKLVSLKMEGNNTWVIDLLPAKGVNEATIMMLYGGATTEIPVTVAPPIPNELKIGRTDTLTERDFNLFLKEQGTEKAPRFDLNGDGKRDYIDDYIFTANYLVNSKRGKH